jgi:hypothetical protein
MPYCRLIAQSSLLPIPHRMRKFSQDLIMLRRVDYQCTPPSTSPEEGFLGGATTPEHAAPSQLNPESRHPLTALVSAGVCVSLKTTLNLHLHSSRIAPQLLASPPRTSLYAQALHTGKGKGEAPTLQETFPRSLAPLPDSLPLSG